MTDFTKQGTPIDWARWNRWERECKRDRYISNRNNRQTKAWRK